MAVEALSAIPRSGYFQTSYLLMLTTMRARDSVIVSGEKEYGIYKMPRGPTLNLFRLSKSEKILLSSPSICTETDAGSLNGFLKLSIEEVLLPTAVEIG